MGSTFLTQFGVEHYDGLEKYTVSGTSQSTLLLQKKKKMQEVQQELDRKKLEYELRMKKCKSKESELAEKQEKIRESVVKFEKFVKENDAKRARAMKKEKDEINSRKQKEQEIISLKQQLEEQTKFKDRLVRMLEKLSVYEAYLDSVLEQSDEFQEVNDVLMRHATLTATNQDLREVVEHGNQQIEVLRASVTHYNKEKEDEILVATSDIAGHQKRSELLKNDNSKVEQQLIYRDSVYNEKKRKLGEAKMAIANIYQRIESVRRLKKAGQPQQEDITDLNKLLDDILQRMLDYQDITRMASEKNRK